jgi:hypothetical protein
MRQAWSGNRGRSNLMDWPPLAYLGPGHVWSFDRASLYSAHLGSIVTE